MSLHTHASAVILRVYIKRANRAFVCAAQSCLLMMPEPAQPACCNSLPCPVPARCCSSGAAHLEVVPDTLKGTYCGGGQAGAGRLVSGAGNRLQHLRACAGTSHTHLDEALKVNIVHLLELGAHATEARVGAWMQQHATNTPWARAHVHASQSQAALRREQAKQQQQQAGKQSPVRAATHLQT